MEEFAESTEIIIETVKIIYGFFARHTQYDANRFAFRHRANSSSDMSKIEFEVRTVAKKRSLNVSTKSSAD